MTKKPFRPLPVLLAGAALAAGAVAASGTPARAADDVKIGILAAITGPIANLAPPLVDAAQLAIGQVNDGGGILGGRTLTAVVGDSACNPQSSVDAATKLINVEQVTAIFGAMCSGAHIAAVNSVAVPNGVVMVSGTATSPQVTTLKDNDLAFRTVPSDGFQGAASARNVLARGTRKVAVTYVNNDYGTGLAEAFKETFEAGGGTVTAFLAHEDKKASYRSELATLAKGGADTLVIFAYSGGSGLTLLRQSLENAYFEKFIASDGMKDDLLLTELGAENLGGLVLTAPSAPPESQATERFNTAYAAAGGDVNGVFVGQAYDAAFLLALAIEQAGSTDRSKIAAALRSVATAPGEPILPGEWEKARKLIAAGKEIDYQGATGDQEFDANGDVAGLVAEIVVKDGTYVQTKMLK